MAACGSLKNMENLFYMVVAAGLLGDAGAALTRAAGWPQLFRRLRREPAAL